MLNKQAWAHTHFKELRKTRQIHFKICYSLFFASRRKEYYVLISWVVMREIRKFRQVKIKIKGTHNTTITLFWGCLSVTHLSTF